VADGPAHTINTSDKGAAIKGVDKKRVLAQIKSKASAARIRRTHPNARPSVPRRWHIRTKEIIYFYFTTP
jgi:hypothetical protein